jgi:hypothetical protein
MKRINIEDIDHSVFQYNPQDKEVISHLQNEYPNHFGNAYYVGDNHKSIQNKKKEILKYIIYVYDKFTPLKDRVPDLVDRKYQACLLAGFKINSDGTFDEPVIDMIAGKVDAINASIAKYLTLSFDPDHMLITRAWDMYTIEISRSWHKHRGDEATVKVLERLNKIIKDKTKDILGGDDAYKIKRHFYKALEVHKLEIRPENMARLIQSKEIDLQSPYE